MNAHKVGISLIVLGISGTLLSVLVDLLPTAKAGVQAAQIAGIEIGVVISLVGFWIALTKTPEKIQAGKKIADFFRRLLNAPLLTWLLLSFLTIYLLFFIAPVFLNDIHRMRYFTTYLPDRFPIGNDMIDFVNLIKNWFTNGQSPYHIQFYPPLSYILYAPALLISDYATLFVIFTSMTLVSYFALTFLIPVAVFRMEKAAIVLIFFLTGLISYGLQFELERGQYNVLTFLLCILSIYIFHYRPAHRIFAYLLFSLAIQLKLYPAIFILMLVDDWRNWKRIALRFIGIGFFNFILLFAMGYKAFIEFTSSALTQLATPGWLWTGNHSIKSFVKVLGSGQLGLTNAATLTLIQQNSERLSMLFLLIIAVCLLLSVWISYLRREGGVDYYLLLSCTLVALTVPISNDYTLSILAAPMALFFASLPEIKDSRNKVVSILLIIGISLSYALVLTPFKYRPAYLGNAFPSLLVILIFATGMNFIRHFSTKRSMESAVQTQ